MAHLSVVEQEADNARGQHVTDPRGGHPCQDLKNDHKKRTKYHFEKNTKKNNFQQGGRGEVVAPENEAAKNKNAPRFSRNTAEGMDVLMYCMYISADR